MRILYFEVADGNITVDPKKLTLYNSVLMNVTLMVLLWSTCREYNKQCRVDKTPMVSGTMVHEMHCRTFTLILTYYMFTSIQMNVRSFYKLLHGIVPESSNNRMAALMTLYICMMPIGIVLDQDRFDTPHRCLAMTTFISGGIYKLWLALQLNKHRERFPLA